MLKLTILGSATSQTNYVPTEQIEIQNDKSTLRACEPMVLTCSPRYAAFQARTSASACR
jgi:hypothetical protein